MTSKCTQSAPAASTASTSSPSRAKFAERMDGAMMQSDMAASGLGAQLADGVVGGVDLAGLLLRLAAQVLGHATQAVGVVLGNQAAVGTVDLGLAGVLGQAQHLVGVVLLRPEPVGVEGVTDQRAERATGRMPQQQPAGDEAEQLAVPPHGAPPAAKPGREEYQAASASMSAGCRLLARLLMGTCWRRPLR